MHRFWVCVLDALRDCGIEILGQAQNSRGARWVQRTPYGFPGRKPRPLPSTGLRAGILGNRQQVTQRVLGRPAAILLLAYLAFSNHVESLRSLPRGASREYL